MNDSNKKGSSLTVSLHGKEMLFSITKPSQEKSTNLVVNIERDTLAPNWVSEALKHVEDPIQLSSLEIRMDPNMDRRHNVHICDDPSSSGCECGDTIKRIVCDIVLYAALTIEKLALSINFLPALLERLPLKGPGADRPKDGEHIPFASITSILFKHVKSDFLSLGKPLLQLVRYWRWARYDRKMTTIDLEPLIIMYPSEGTENAETRLNNVLNDYRCEGRILTVPAPQAIVDKAEE